MKKELLSSLLLSILCMVLLCVGYPLFVYLFSFAASGKGEGQQISGRDGKHYYANIAQSFTADKYFWSRPSAVNYNAAGSGGSNKGPNNPDLLADISKRIDTFMAHNPGVNRKDIPSDLVTASGSGLDPDISIQAALVQAARIARARNLPVNTITDLVHQHAEKPLWGIFGPEKVNVLKLNISLQYLDK